MSRLVGDVATARPRKASLPPPQKPPAQPLIGDTGSVKLNAVADVINTTAAPFQNAPDPAKGTLGEIEHGIGAVMGVVGAPFQLLDTGFAMITAPLAAMMPGLPAATLMMPHLGTPHGHLHPLSLIPPNPVPVPLPSIGVVMLAGSVSVLIGGVPAARASDVGLAPLCFGFAPAFDIWTGSSNTWIGGSRAARMLDITRHCNPASAMGAIGKAMGAIGVVAGAVSAGASAAGGDALKASMQAAQAAADAAALAMSALLGKDPGIPPSMGAIMMGNPTVLIGGFPMPDVLELLGGLVKGLKMLGKAVGKSKVFGKILSKVGLCNAPGEPVNPYTGEVFNDFEDYRALDTKFSWERHYRSGWNQEDGPFGYGYRHVFQRTLTLLRRRAIYETHDGEVVALEKREDGSYVPTAGFALTVDGRYLRLQTDRGETLHFVAEPGTDTDPRLEIFRNEHVNVWLSYDTHGRLASLAESLPGQTIATSLVYDERGHVIELRRGVRGQASAAVICRYAYDDAGCLVECFDALGASKRFRYDGDHRMVQGTDRRGYSFHWSYDPATGRCIKSHGDDGLWGLEARYEGSWSAFTEPDGGTWTFKHYPDGTISHLLGPDGGVLQYVKDESGRITQQVMPGGSRYTWLYDAEGKHTGRRDSFGCLSPPEDEEPNPPNPLDHRGPKSHMEWLHGRPLLRLAPRSPPLSEAIWQALAETRPAAPRGTPRPEPARDVMGRVSEEIHPDGSRERFQHDAEGNLLARQDAHGNWWRQEIVSWNKIGVQKSPTGRLTRYGYSHHAQVAFIVDGNGNRTDYVRDQRQRISSIAVNGVTHVAYLRDLHNSVVEERDGSGQWLVKYETNALGLHTAATLASGERYTYQYDAFGNFTSASSKEHEVTQRHSARRRTHDLRDGLGVEHSFRLGRLESTRALGQFATRYAYTAGALHVLTPDGSSHGFWLVDQATIVRKNGNGTFEATSFDHGDRLAARLCWTENGRDPSWETRYCYDAAGELLHTIDSHAGVTHYAFDPDGRLLTQRDPDGFERHYRYDDGDGLSYTPNHRHIERLPGNRLSYSQAERFEYDDRACLCRRHQPDGSVVTYLYDSANQLVEVRWSDRSEIWRAGYDGLGRRLWREYGGQRTELYWDGDRLAAEVAPDGKLRLYVYANEDALVPFMWLDYASVGADPKSGTPFYLFTAPTGMPLRVEDAQGEVAWRADSVDAYGEIAVAPESRLHLRLRFAGHFEDEHTGLFYNRFRDYDPGLGRYMQPDPWGQAGGLNLYAYPSNPLVYVDLRGLVHKAKAGAVPLEQQNGAKRPTGAAADPEVKARREADLEPRTDLPRGEDGLVTRGAAKAECDRLAETRRQHMLEDHVGLSKPQSKVLAEQQGPVVSVTMDRRTGETFHGHNDTRPPTKETGKRLGAATGQKPGHTGKPPKDVAPVLGKRVDELEQNPRHLTDDGRSKSNPGSHAEVHSTNGALKDRAGHTEMPQGEDALPELTTVQRGRETGNSVPCCPNCSHITRGADQASGTVEQAGDRFVPEQ